MKKSPRDRLVLALDNVPSLEALSKLVLATAPFIGVFKIGFELFTRFGPPLCDIVRNLKRKIFLDLKYHDIPTTVEKAVSSACALRVDYLTVHALGGISMMRAAKKSAEAFGLQKHGEISPKIIGVTLLTSIDSHCLLNDLLMTSPPSDYVRHLAVRAVQSGLDGIVCSASDLPFVKPLLPPGFVIITPGIRLPGSDAHDQKRIASPTEALKNGATLLVVGRAVTATSDPAKAAESLFATIAGSPYR